MGALVIVAGVSCAGKTAFIAHLKAGHVPGLALPDGALGWPVVEQARDPVWPRGEPGVILHYDMNGRGLCDGAAFANDPALAFVAQAKAITVIDLRPPLDRLLAQAHARIASEEQAFRQIRSGLPYRIGAPVLRALRPVLPGLRKRLHRRLFGRGKPRCYADKLYRGDGTLDSLYARWDAYLESVAASGVAVRRMSVTPNGRPFEWDCIHQMIPTSV